METQKRKVLFISKHVVHDGVPMAGNQLFNDTLKSFCNDERFECAFVVVQKKGADIQKMQEQFVPIAKDFSVFFPKVWTPFTYLFYNTKLGLQLAHFEPKWLMLDPFYKFYYKKAIKQVIKSDWTPDVIVLEWTEMLFLEKYCRKIFPRAKLVVTEHDVAYIKIQRRFADKPGLQKLIGEPFKYAELRALSFVDLIRVLSQDDRDRLVANGVPIQKISVTAPFFQNKNLEAKLPLENKIVFYGAMNRIENQEAVEWFLEKVFIPFDLSDLVAFVIVGGGKNDLKDKYANQKGVSFFGFVKEPSEIFVKSLAMVVPLLNGGGIKIKVLESMTCSLPVLTNEIGMEGIGGRSGEQFLSCNTAKEYANAIRFLFEEESERIRIGNAAREWVTQKFNYPKDLALYKEELLAMDSKTIE